MSTGIYPRKIRSKKYPISFRQRAFDLHKKGLTFFQIAEILGTKTSIIHYWVRQIEPVSLINGKYWLGKKRPQFSEETRQKMSVAKKGEKSVRWIIDREQVKRQEERNNPEYKQWRMSIWKRDNFTCCIKNNDCKGKIEAHHILSWSEHPELRYSVNNGITVCHFHHPRKKVEEKALIHTFQELILTTNN